MIQVGVARVDITPPSRIGLVGFAGRDETTGIHDPLYATALVASFVNRSVAIVSCDLLGMYADFANTVRQEASKIANIDPEDMVISCTHTHYGPDLYKEATTAKDAAYQNNLKFQLVDLIADASANREDARIGVGFGESDIGINRRERREDGTIWLGENPKGPVDRSVGVCRIDSLQGRPLAVLLNFATHPVVQSGSTCHISADYPGVTRRVIEDMTGATCLFLQGAGANINPIIMESSFSPVVSLGRRLACEALRVWETIEPSEAKTVAASSQEVQLPRYTYDSLENAQRLVGELDAELSAAIQKGVDESGTWWLKRRLERIREAVDAWQNSDVDYTMPVTLHAISIGHLAITFTPGEVFNQIGRTVKEQSPVIDTFFVAYTNDAIGYIPTREAYAEGGYEVTHACRVDPDASELIINTLHTLLEELSI